MFNCDGEFDFTSMGRIFMGLCKCGAWGCFDEFNRLEENVLSAVSQQIQIIQASTSAVYLAISPLPSMYAVVPWTLPKEARTCSLLRGCPQYCEGAAAWCV